MIYQQFSDLYELLLPYSEKPCKECGLVRLLQFLIARKTHLIIENRKENFIWVSVVWYGPW